MGLFTTIVNAFDKASGWLDDTQDLLKGNIESDEYKELKDQVTDNTAYLDAGRFINQNDVLKRFHLGNEFLSDSHNDVFVSGFEDPTRLMFKIEFGDWGNSLLDIETIRNQQTTSKFSNVYYEDYDQMPMGLLNLDFRDFQGPNSFNLQTAYNSYNYLLNNNEDARSLYLKQFILGLYTIQKDFPYLFLKITGIDKLQEFNSTNGRRLKDAKITLDCLEGIDLKIKTLLELYRKAAYDDVWQRWVLPDIYRYFKMIIYVFDRRILHTGVGTYSTDQDYFPIYAFECGPCEIEISSTLDNDFSASYADHKDAASQIVINVKNVKTYFSNRLLNKIDSLSLKTNWISDFDSVKERNSFTAVDQNNFENFRARWLKRMFMMPSDYKAYYLNMTHKIGDDYDKNKLLFSNDIYGPILPKNSWHNAVVTDPIYSIQSWNGLKKYFKKLLTTRTTLIRDSRTDDKDIMLNDLTRPYWDTYIYDYNLMFETLNYKQSIEYIKDHIAQMIQHMLNSTYLIDNKTYYHIVDPGLINNYEKQEMNLVNNTSMYLDKPDMEFVEPIFNLDKHHIDVVNNTSMYLDKPDMEFVEPIFNLDKHHIDMINNTSMYLDKPDMEFVEPIFNLDKHHIDMINNTSMYLDKPDMEFVEPIFNLDKNYMNFIYPVFDEHKSNMTFVHPLFDITKFYMNLLSDTQDTHKAGMNLILDIHDEHKADMNLLPDIQDTHKPDMNLLPDIHDEHKSEMNLLPDIHDEHKPDMNLLPDIHDEHKSEMNLLHDTQDTHKATMNLLSDTHDEHKTNMNLLPDVHDEHKPDMNLLPDTQDIHKATMNLLPDTQDTHKATMNLLSDVHDKHKPEMNLLPDIHDDHKAGMNLILDVHDEHKPEMNLLLDIHDDHKAKMNLLPDTHDEHKPEMNLLPDIHDEHKALLKNVSLINNLDKPDMKYIYPDMNTSIPDMDMIYPDMNTSIPDMDMVYPDMNTSIPDMKFIKPDMNTSIPDMKFIKPDMNTSIPDMKFIKPNMNTSISDMQFISPNMDVSIPDMKFIKPNMNTSIPDMKFIKPDMNTSIPDMQMVSPNMNVSIPDMLMIQPNMNVSMHDMQMIQPDMNTDKVDMIMSSIYLNLDKPDIDMVKPIYDDVNIDMLMVLPILNNHKPKIDMVNINSSTDNILMDFVSPIFNIDKPNMVMNTYDVNVDKPKLKLILNTSLDYNINMQMYSNYNNVSILDMQMVSPNMNVSLPNMKLQDNKPLNTSSPNMLMVNLSLDVSLVHKIEALTKIDINEIKTLDVDKLLSLANIIDTTVEEIKEHAKNMKLLDNKPNIPKHVHMKMTSIKQPPRRLFIADHLINEVDKVAMDRAFNAKQNANADNDDYSTTGTRGNVL